jgi:hypothetical protein
VADFGSERELFATKAYTKAEIERAQRSWSCYVRTCYATAM